MKNLINSIKNLIKNEKEYELNCTYIRFIHDIMNNDLYQVQKILKNDKIMTEIIKYFIKDLLNFFENNSNSHAQQFTKTGGLNLPSPNAQQSELADDAAPLKPLSDMAEAALASLKKDYLTTSLEVSEFKGVHSNVKNQSTDNPIPIQKNQVSAIVISNNLMSEENIHSSQPSIQPENLLPTSRYGFHLVDEVARSIIQPSRAPRGFFWIVPNILAACPQPGVSDPINYDLDLLANLGITTLITLTEKDFDQPSLKQAGLKNIHLPIYDREPPSMAQMHMLVFKMQRAIDNNEVLAVHCLAGLGRTGTIIVAWMMKEGGLSAEEALKRARQINPNFVQSENQEKALVEFEIDILRRIR